MTQAMFGVGKTGRALYSHLRNSEWQRKTVGRESHVKVGFLAVPDEWSSKKAVVVF